MMCGDDPEGTEAMRVVMRELDPVLEALKIGRLSCQEHTDIHDGAAIGSKLISIQWNYESGFTRHERCFR